MESAPWSEGCWCRLRHVDHLHISSTPENLVCHIGLCLLAGFLTGIMDQPRLFKETQKSIAPVGEGRCMRFETRSPTFQSERRERCRSGDKDNLRSLTVLIGTRCDVSADSCKANKTLKL